MLERFVCCSVGPHALAVPFDHVLRLEHRPVSRIDSFIFHRQFATSVMPQVQPAYTQTAQAAVADSMPDNVIASSDHEAQEDDIPAYFVAGIWPCHSN